MRDIKFRVWSSESKKMYLPKKGCDFLVRIDGEYFVDEDIVENVGLIPVKREGYILMQYTGLKDSSGKEIYEGDIVEFLFRGRRVITRDEVWAAFGFWDGSAFIVLSDYKEHHQAERTILGNIYENPDLLKEEKR